MMSTPDSRKRPRLEEAHSAPIASESLGDSSTQLRDDGWCVLPLFAPTDVDAIRSRFWAAVATFPEFLPEVSTANVQQHFVQGGFGALGNPASFHNPFVREWRARALAAVVEQRAFSAVMEEHPAGAASVRLEAIIDRMLVRRPSKRASAESWHRDEAVGARGTESAPGPLDPEPVPGPSPHPKS